MPLKSDAPVSVKFSVSKIGMFNISPIRGNPSPSNASSMLGKPLIVRLAPALLSPAPLPAAGSSDSVKYL